MYKYYFKEMSLAKRLYKICEALGVASSYEVLLNEWEEQVYVLSVEDYIISSQQLKIIEMSAGYLAAC